MLTLKHPIVFAGVSIALLIGVLFISSKTQKPLYDSKSIQMSMYIAQLPIKKPASDPIMLYTQLVVSLSHISATLKASSPQHILKLTSVDVQQLKERIIQVLRQVIQHLNIPEEQLRTVLL